MPEQRRPPTPPAWVWLVGAVFLYAALLIHEVLVPFALGFALAYLLNPIVQDFEVRGLRRTLIVLVIYGLVAVGVTLSLTALIPKMAGELALLQRDAPTYFVRMQESFEALKLSLAHMLPFGQKLVEAMSFKMYDPIVEQLPKLPSYALSLLPFLSLLALVPFITFFVLMDSNSFLNKVIQICPSRHVEQALHVLSEIDVSLGNYIRGLLIISIVVGSCSYIGLTILGVDYALAISALAGLSSFIPYVGAIVGLVVGALVAFFQFQTVWVPLKVVALFVGIRVGDEIFVQPIVARHSVHLHPMVFLLSLMIGAKLFGFVGMLFGVPAACVIKALIMVAWDWYISEAQIKPRSALPLGSPPYI